VLGLVILENYDDLRTVGSRRMLLPSGIVRQTAKLIERLDGLGKCRKSAVICRTVPRLTSAVYIFPVS